MVDFGRVSRGSQSLPRKHLRLHTASIRLRLNMLTRYVKVMVDIKQVWILTGPIHWGLCCAGSVSSIHDVCLLGISNNSRYQG